MTGYLNISVNKHHWNYSVPFITVLKIDIFIILHCSSVPREKPPRYSQNMSGTLAFNIEKGYEGAKWVSRSIWPMAREAFGEKIACVPRWGENICSPETVSNLKEVFCNEQFYLQDFGECIKTLNGFPNITRDIVQTCTGNQSISTEKRSSVSFTSRFLYYHSCSKSFYTILHSFSR